MDTVTPTERPWLDPQAALERAAPAVERLEGPEPASAGAARYGFRFGNVGVLIPPGKTGEIVEQAHVFPVPNSPGWLRGLINLRGNLVPVIDLGTFFDAGGTEGDTARVLVVDKDESAAAFPVERLPQPVRVSGGRSQAPPMPRAIERFVKGAFVSDGEIWIDVALDGFLESLSGAPERPAATA